MGTPPFEPRDEFLGDGDLSLQELTDEQLIAWWNLWLGLAQSTNDVDEATYEHGVFERDPAVDGRRARDARERA